MAHPQSPASRVLGWENPPPVVVTSSGLALLHICEPLTQKIFSLLVLPEAKSCLNRSFDVVEPVS